MAPKASPKGRTRIKGVRQNQSAFLRDGVSNGMKTAIINCFHDLGMGATVTNFFPRTSHTQVKSKKQQIYKWIQKEEAILSAVGSGRGHLQKIRATGLATVLCDEDEDLIAHWVRNLRREGVPVSQFMLKTKLKGFSASDSWEKRFLAKYRFSLRRKSRIGQITPVDSEQVAQDFRLEVLITSEEEGIVEVYNADQTAKNYEYLPSRTYDTKGIRTVWIHNAGADKNE
ncbi:Hypothetical protein PHPALM_8549 [Phytophthora palmivora]|uniref:HTH CENPB-type domain-containing protein n=1 Tax=Phytophthora palmivora TaxID=4796 RepID=A0A2P4Y9Y2_9STRA|nr:Hypothetical protein PHPALM_8549 [Phytophthora palmivora]